MDPSLRVRVTDEGEMVSVQWFFRWLGCLCGLGFRWEELSVRPRRHGLFFFCGTVFGLVLSCVTWMTRFERLAGSGRSAVMDDVHDDTNRA